MHAFTFNASVIPARRFIGRAQAIANRVNHNYKNLRYHTNREAMAIYWLTARLHCTKAAQSVVQFAIALAEIESYNNFRGQFIAANVQIGRWAIQAVVEIIKAVILTRMAFDVVTDRLCQLAAPVTHVRKLEIFLSGHGFHSDKEVM